MNYRYATDAYGQIIEREEYDDAQPYSVLNLPKTRTYRFGGREIGVVTNDGTDNVDYTALIGHRDDVGNGPFRYGSNISTSYKDFDNNHVTIAGGAQADTPGFYMVRGGETFQSIALAVWGDADLWYKLAEANGISGGSLLAGQRLVIPNGIVGIHHNAETIKPYDPSRALGDLSPPHVTPPKPTSKDGGCGIVGQILVAVVGIAITAIAPISGGWLAQIGNGLLGNVAGQAVGNITGVQDGFSFKSLALTGLSAGINVGLGQNGLLSGGAFGNVKSGLVQSALRGATSNAIAQGVATATGLQDKFSWAGVAAAGVSAGVAYGLGGKLLPVAGPGADRSFENIAGHVGVRTAALIADTATRSAIDGSSFADNVLAGLPNVIGQVLGDVVSGMGRPNPRGGGPENLIPDAFDDISLQQPDAPVAANPSASNSQTSGELAEIVVTARAGVAELRKGLGLLVVSEWNKVIISLTQGKPYVEAPPMYVEGVEDIPGGLSDARGTLAGTINSYAYFTEGTFDDLSAYLLKNYVAGDGSDIPDVIERISWETEGNEMMLGANIVALHATGNPVLTEIASGLEEVAIERWLDGGMQAAAAADREVENLIRVNPLLDDFFLVKDVIQGRASQAEIGIAAGAHAIPVVGALGKGLLAAETRMARAVRLGREGERAAGIVGPKVGIMINGQRRFPDELTQTVIREVKNVKYQGWTKQLRDYADFARQRNIPFELWLRPGTNVSRNVTAAERRGEVIIMRKIR